MQKSFFLWVLISLSVAGGICGCKQSSKQNSTQLTKSSDTTVPEAPPYDNPPGVQMSVAKRCYSNLGLKYEVTVILEYKTDTTFTGQVISRNLETDLDEITPITGRSKNGNLLITFTGNAPVIGAATEWLDKPWRIEKTNAKSPDEEMLHIPVKAKNYENNKWEETVYDLSPGDCK